MKMLITLAAVLAAAVAQPPTTPPMKMGLWESTGTMKMRQPDGTDKSTDRITRSCVTRGNWLTLMGPTASNACPKTNEIWTPDSYSFDVMCAGKPKMASVSIHFDSPDAHHGMLDMSAMPDGSPAVMHAEFSDHWVGTECGDVSPDQPVIVR